MGIPLLKGRDFTDRDNRQSSPVAIVNETFARFYFGAGNPLGKRIGPGGKQATPDFTIVGVAKDGKYENLKEAAQRFWYIPYEQHKSVRRLNLYVRTTRDPLRLAKAVRETVRNIDPSVAVFDLKTLEQQVNENIATDRMIATLCTFFSLLAAFVAAIGLYGTMTYSVTRRTREIGIRMALGAARSRVVGMVLREAGLLIVVGLAAGLAGALAAARLIASMLYEVKPADPVALTGAALLMAAVALVAGYLPARRASRVDPMQALRVE